MFRVRGVAPFAAVALLVAGCAGGSSGAPDWTGAAPHTSEPNGITVVPEVPGDNGQGSAPSTQPPTSGSSSAHAGGTTDPSVVATHLTSPTGVVVLPNGTALVGERRTGRIVQVQPRPGQPTPTVKTLTGLDTTGDGGLLDLAISPNYGEDSLIYAYITTRTDNRVVEFTLHGPVTPIFVGIPRGSTDNTGRIVFANDGNLLIGTGDAGRPALAQDPHSLAGKILRVTDIGRPAAHNPTRTAVYDSGHRAVTGLCVVPDTGAVLETETAADGTTELNLIAAGADHGWPSAGASDTAPIGTLPSTAEASGGCAVRDSTVYVTSLDGRRLMAAAFVGSGHPIATRQFRQVLGAKYGRLRTVVVAPDGAIWLTTSNKDGHGKPVPTDERVIRILGGQVSTSPT